MKLTILPNWGKWISLGMLVASLTFTIIFDREEMVQSFMQGCNEGMARANPLKYELPVIPPETESELNVKNMSSHFDLSDLLLFLAIIVYILSKDKRDDEYLDAIRAKALLLALLFTTVVAMLVYICNGTLESVYLLFIQLLSYIIVFKFMKMRADVLFDEEQELAS